MATELIATGSTSGTASSDLVVTSPVTVGLKGVSGDRPPVVRIELYDGANYVLVGRLNESEPALLIAAPGTYRFVRATGTCGVFSG